MAVAGNSGDVEAAKTATLLAASAEEVAEFADSPVYGTSLFVHAKWNVDACADGVPDAEETALCRLLACDGERCWEGALLRSHLAAQLGDSWRGTGGLRLLLGALAEPRSGGSSQWSGDQPSSTLGACATLALGVGSAATASAPAGLAGAAPPPFPLAEASWTCPEGSAGPLKLVVRFIYREGPITAVPGVLLPPCGLSAGLSTLFGLAHGAQVAASACAAAAEEECAALQGRKESLKRDLDALESQVAAEEARLLEEFAAVLNAQKRRCRRLWEAGRGGLAIGGAGAALAIPTAATIGQCIDLPDEPAPPEAPRLAAEGPAELAAGAAAGQPDTCAWGSSLAYCSPPGSPRGGSRQPRGRQDTCAWGSSLAYCSPPTQAASAAVRGPEPNVFSIPLTLGMNDTSA